MFCCAAANDEADGGGDQHGEVVRPFEDGEETTMKPFILSPSESNLGALSTPLLGEEG